MIIAEITTQAQATDKHATHRVEIELNPGDGPDDYTVDFYCVDCGRYLEQSERLARTTSDIPY